jgi:hypothetical protein
MIAIAGEKNQISIPKLVYQYNYLHKHDFVRVKKRRGGEVALTEIREFVQRITCKLLYCESCGNVAA